MPWHANLQRNKRPVRCSCGVVFTSFKRYISRTKSSSLSQPRRGRRRRTFSIRHVYTGNLCSASTKKKWPRTRGRRRNSVWDIGTFVRARANGATKINGGLGGRIHTHTPTPTQRRGPHSAVRSSDTAPIRVDISALIIPARGPLCIVRIFMQFIGNPHALESAHIAWHSAIIA